MAGFMAEPVERDQSKFLQGLAQAAQWGLQEVIKKLDAPGRGASIGLCKRPFPSLHRRLSGPWESGNPGFGFPLFHCPKVFLVFGVYS
jgi:hypothetical protein